MEKNIRWTEEGNLGVIDYRFKDFSRIARDVDFGENGSKQTGWK